MSKTNHEVKRTLHQDGYSQEEKYFYELNRELIRKARKQRLEEREKSDEVWKNDPEAKAKCIRA